METNLSYHNLCFHFFSLYQNLHCLRQLLLEGQARKIISRTTLDRHSERCIMLIFEDTECQAWKRESNLCGRGKTTSYNVQILIIRCLSKLKLAPFTQRRYSNFFLTPNCFQGDPRINWGLSIAQ